MKRERRFQSEADLCVAFCNAAKLQGWVPYAETHGWDVLLVHEDGTQIGVQAKLYANVKLLHQTVEYAHPEKPGPDFRAALIPEYDTGFVNIARRLNVVTLAPRLWYSKADDFDLDISQWEPHRWHPKSRHVLPEFVPDVIPGASGPIKLTHWKIKAIKLCCRLRRNGYVTSADFKELKLNAQLFLDRWLDSDGKKPARYTLKAERVGKMPDEQHPKVTAEIMATMEAA